MPGINNPDASAATPNRRNKVYFDIPETIVLESAWSEMRMGHEIAPMAVKNHYADGNFATNLRQWASQAITLRPIQDFLPWVQEKSPDGVTPDQYTYSPTAPNDATKMTTAAVLNLPQFKKPTMTGVNAGAGILVSGDNFLQKRVEADSPDWGAGVLTVAPTYMPPSVGVLSAPPVTLPTPPPAGGGVMAFPQPANANVPIDPIGISTLHANADQGFHIRWFVPGTNLDNPDFVVALSFGQYSVYMLGDGQAQIWENCHDAAGAAVFRVRETFRYCRPSEVCDNDHHLMIFPHQDTLGNKYVSFKGSHMGSGAPSVLSVAGTSQMEEHLYTANEISRGSDRDESPGHVTRADLAIMYARRDLRVKWALSVLRFAATGAVVDQPLSFPLWSSAQKVGLYLSAGIPALPAERAGNTPYQIVAQIADAPVPGTALATLRYTSANETLQQTPTAVQLSAPFVSFWFFGDGWNTPILWGYKMQRDVVTSRETPGEFHTSARTINITSGDMTPQSESAQVMFHDDKYALPRLALRGEFASKITTTFTPPAVPDEGNGSTLVITQGLGGNVILQGFGSTSTQDRTEREITLFRGYAVRPHGVRLGIQDPTALAAGTVQGIKTGAGGSASTTRVSPSPEWRAYDISMVGLWKRLGPEERTARTSRSFRTYAEDQTAPPDPALSGARPPWRVTDAITDCFLCGGFPLSMINITQSPIRLYIGPHTATEDQMIEPNSDFLSRAIALARNYLGAVPFFDTTASDEGQWILIYPGTMTQTLFHFQTYGNNVSAIPHLPGGYDYNHGFIAGHHESYVIRPERNHVRVFTAPPDVNASGALRVENEFHNHKSYRVPGSTVTPDPDDPNYIGREVLYLLPAPELWVSGANSYQRTQDAVDLVAYRMFQFLCRARQVLPFVAPLYMVRDPVTMKWRTMRLGDRVTYNNQTGWFVRSVNPSWKSDFAQMCRYELERLVPL